MKSYFWEIFSKQTKLTDMDEIGSTVLTAGVNAHTPLQVWGLRFIRVRVLGCSINPSLNLCMTIRCTTPVHHLCIVQFVFFFLGNLFVSHSSTCHSYLRQPLCCEIKNCHAPSFREHPDSKIIVHSPKKIFRWIIILWQWTQQSWTVIHSPLLRTHNACTRVRNTYIHNT